MDEFISRKAAIAYIREQSEECQKAFEELGGESGIYADAYNDLAEDFYSIPAAVDAVPVVRCKDCKHLCVWNRKDIYAFCPKTNIVFLPFEKDTRTFFCGFGERKDGGDG
jgi:hypothetical protein|nr:MAG TPA: hypothetical protein [Caudoviricetes sp.]